MRGRWDGGDLSVAVRGTVGAPVMLTSEKPGRAGMLAVVRDGFRLGHLDLDLDLCEFTRTPG